MQKRACHVHTSTQGRAQGGGQGLSPPPPPLIDAKFAVEPHRRFVGSDMQKISKLESAPPWSLGILVCGGGGSAPPPP